MNLKIHQIYCIDPSSAEGKFRIGQEVHHRIFGDGTVIDCEGDGEDMKVKVRFAKVGTKMLIASYLEGL